MDEQLEPVEQENALEAVEIEDENELDSIAGGDGGQPSYPPYL